MTAMTSATSRTSTGDVRPLPNGSRIVLPFAIDSAAQAEKKMFWRKTVGRTCTTGNPDQFNACSASQCCTVGPPRETMEPVRHRARAGPGGSGPSGLVEHKRVGHAA
jgi:hypothetical protein